MGGLGGVAANSGRLIGKRIIFLDAGLCCHLLTLVLILRGVVLQLGLLARGLRRACGVGFVAGAPSAGACFALLLLLGLFGAGPGLLVGMLFFSFLFLFRLWFFLFHLGLVFLLGLVGLILLPARATGGGCRRAGSVARRRGRGGGASGAGISDFAAVLFLLGRRIGVALIRRFSGLARSIVGAVATIHLGIDGLQR